MIMKNRGYHHGYSRSHVNGNKLNYTANSFTPSATEIFIEGDARQWPAKSISL